MIDERSVPTLKSMLFCDFVGTEAKKSLVGVFDRVDVAQAPTVLGRFYIYARFEGGSGQFDVRLERVGPDQAILKFPVMKTQMPRGASAHEVVMTIEQMPFPKLGKYKFVLYVDDCPAGDYTVEVKRK